MPPRAFPAFASLAAAFVLAAPSPGPAPPVAATALTVRFEVNDAQVKGKLLEGAQLSVRSASGAAVIATGATDKDGRWSTRLAPGSYEIAYRLAGYVPYTSSATEIRKEGQLVTVSLTRLLEATGTSAREVRIVLNWGSDSSQVRDADSHLVCTCGANDRHVLYNSRRHEGPGHSAVLDVDDTDWGGPETITITDPVPGSYLYWVHDYSGPPATLGASDVVVRVVIGTEQAGEFRAFKGVTRRAWRPFKAIEVGTDGRPAVVRFTEDEIAEGADLAVPEDLQPQGPAPETTPAPSPALAGPGGSAGARRKLVFYGAILVVIALVIRRARRRRP
jgi:hypothetical protein